MPPPLVPIETNLLRKAFVCLGRGATGPVDTEDFLGAVGSTSSFRLVDLEVLGWLGAYLPRYANSVEFSREELAKDLYGRRPGGTERRDVASSLERLASTTISFGGYDAEARCLVRPIAFENVRLIASVEPGRTTRLGQPLTWRASFQPWLLNQMSLGYVTLVDWEKMRALRGLAERLWLYAVADALNGSWRGRPSSYVVLSPKAWRVLGLNYGNESRSREALKRASSRIEELDGYHKFELVKIGSTYRLYIFKNPIWDGLPRRLSSPIFDGSVPSHVGSIHAPWRSKERGRRSATSPSDADGIEVGDEVEVEVEDGDETDWGMGAVTDDMDTEASIHIVDIAEIDVDTYGDAEATFVLLRPEEAEQTLHRASCPAVAEAIYRGLSGEGVVARSLETI